MGLKESGLRGSLRNVSAGIVTIPDSVEHRWRFDEGTGSTFSDTIGSIDGSLNGAGWESDSRFTGGFAVSTDGVDDHPRTDSTFGVNNEQFTFVCWYNWTSTDDFGRLASTIEQPGDRGDVGWQIFLDDSGPEIGVQYDGGTSDALRDVPGMEVPPNEDIMVALVGNGDEATLFLYDSDGQYFSESGTGSRTTGDRHLMLMAGDDDYVEGTVDDAMVSTTDALTESDINDIWSSTVR